MKTPASATQTTDDAARPIPGGRPRALALLAQGQGLYYFLSGAWPVVAPLSFQIVTGAKRDLWLAQTVGLLLAVSGAALFLAGRARRVTREIVLLGAGLAAVLGSVDLWCVFEPLTTRAYWLDSVVEWALVVAWCWFARPQSHDGAR